MTQAIFVNLLNTQLAAAASTTSTTLTLSSSANLPTLASGQFFPLWLQDAATGQVHELVYVTGVSGATLTVERAREGTSAQNWNIGDLAYSNGSSGTFAPITAVHSPVESETLPTANKMVVLPGTLTADIALTLPDSPVIGQEYTIFGSGADYTVTVQTDVTSGSPYIGLPDGSSVYSWVIPAGAVLSGIICIWDGGDWRSRTFGATVVSDATANNEAVALGQLFIGNRKAVFTSNGTYTVPDAVTTIWVSGAGGGGGGGGGNSLSSSAQGAGGGGGYAGNSVLKTPLSVTPGESLTVTIGAGGAGGAGTSSLANAGNGSAGGATTIVNGSSTLLSLSGGGGGDGATVYNTSYVYGGTGFSSGLCVASISDSNTISGTIAIGGTGAKTQFSIGGGGGGNQNSANGANGTNGGGGGGGGAGSAGGAGGNGIIIIEW
jgi:hypothetical protein